MELQSENNFTLGGHVALVVAFNLEKEGKLPYYGGQIPEKEALKTHFYHDVSFQELRRLQGDAHTISVTWTDVAGTKKTRQL